MKMKMKSVSVFLLILVLLEVLYCQGCWKHEREALLGLNGRFDKPLPWVDGTDCCQWERVECNATTGRVAKLNLYNLRSYTLENWYLNYSDFLVFEDLKSLDLSSNQIAGCVENEGLSNLEVLDLSSNSMDNDTSILSCADGFSSLKSLDLSFNDFNATSFHAFETLSSKLMNLEVLDISNNNLTNVILPSLGRFKSLKELYLCYAGLDSDLHIQGLLALSDLEMLDLSSNNIKNFVALQGSKSLSKLEVLKLDENNIDGTMLRKSLRAFSSIRELYLEYNIFNGTVVAEDFRDLGNLEHLVLDNSYNLASEFFKTIGALTSLKVLSLSGCGINGSLPAADWSELKKLERLDLSSNAFEGPLPSPFANMTSLQDLELSCNYFTGNFGSNLASLTSLEYLRFEENQFQVPVSFTPFANLSNLKSIYGDGNKVILDSHPSLQTWVPKFQLQYLSLSSTTESKSLPLPNFLLYQHNLTSVDFTSCKLEGEFPKWLLENNTKMSDLLLRNCSFTGTVQLPSRPHLSISRIDVSDNALTGQIPGNNISSILPNLEFLNLSVNAIAGALPHEFGQMNSLETLDLSDNQLSGELPKNISRVRSPIRLLKLSNNKLDGPIFPTLSTMDFVEHLSLDGNSLSGGIPSSFFNTSLLALDISNNHLSGKLPSRVGNLSKLEALSMSKNHLEGSIPIKFGELESLVYLDISGNKLTGSIPSFVNSSVRFIHLSYNRLSGLSKRMFGENSSIEVLDLRYNELTTSIHDMMQDLSSTRLWILLLRGNHFTGRISNQICRLKDLRILDLSYNNFSGPIPSCLGKIPFKNAESSSSRKLGNTILAEPHVLAAANSGNLELGFSVVQEKAEFTTKKRSYNYTWNVLIYMTGIDLSCNKLNGKIPSELGNLKNIRALNLSRNCLTGQIPATFSKLVQIESMDLSFNNLSGSIPPQLHELTSLEVFSVAYNNLSGATPETKGQFLTFEESSYEGNPFLCGPPLPKNCACFEQRCGNSADASYANGNDNDCLVDMYVFGVSFAVSYTSVLLVIAASLYINPHWRRAWFYYIELVTTNCYYFIKDNLHKFSM